MKRGKRYNAIQKELPGQALAVGEAIAFAIEHAKAKFDESIELHIKLGVDTTKPEQSIRLAVALPHGTGRSLKVAAFVPENMEAEAKEAGAAIVGGDELIDQIRSTGKMDFEAAVAHPLMMPKLATIAKILGPKGLMPSPKTETVGPKVGELIKSLLAGKVNLKMDETGNVHASFGKVSFGPEKLLENLTTLLDAIEKARPKGIKGVYMKSLTIATTMGPGIAVTK